MPDLPTRLDYFAIGRQVIVETSTKIDPAQVDVEGSDANLVVGVGSVMADAITKQLAYRTAALTLDGSDDEDLDRWAFDHYQIVRKGASPARGTVKITRTSIAAGSGTVPIGTKIETGTAVEYVTITTANFGSTSTETTCKVRAVQAGKATQAGAGQLSRFQRPQLLWDPSLQVTNEKPTAGGEDVESDEVFKARIRDFWRTARRGVLGAIEFGALTVPGVTSARAIETLSSTGLPARVVNLYISDSSGVASDALADDVRAALEEYRAGGIAVLIFTSSPLIVDLVIKLTFLAGVDTQTLTDQVRAALVEYVNSLPVNGILDIAGLYSVIRRFVEDGVIPTASSLVSPVGDLVPTVGQTLRTTLANVVSL